MKSIVSITAAAMAVSMPLHAAQVQLTLDYDISVFGFRPTDDFSSGGPSGFANPNGPDYDESRTDTFLQDVFSSDDPFAGATFQDGSVWIQDPLSWDFDSLRATFTIDTDDFLKENVVGADPDDVIRFYDFDATIEIFKDDVFVEAFTNRGYHTAAADDVEIGGTDEAPIIGDAIGVRLDLADPTSLGTTEVSFLFGDNTGTKQFQDLPAGGSALEQAFTPGSIGLFEFDQQVFEPDGAAGLYFIQGAIQDFDLVALGDVATVGGSSEEAPLVPDAPEPGEPASETFGFTVDIETLRDAFEGTPVVWIDPIVAVGYTYTIEDPEGNLLPIAGVIAPSLEFVNDPDGYFVEFSVGGTNYKEAIDPGEQRLFSDIIGGPGVVTEFMLTGIDPNLLLDPTNPTLFRTGIIPGRGVTGEVRLTQTPITEDFDPAPIPLPLPATMLLAGLGGLLLVRRKTA